MWGGSQRRGVSEVLGAILVFAILVSGIAVYQVTVVPQTNEEREVEHSQEVRSSMQDLRSAIVTTGSGGGPRSVSVRTSVDYPTRSLTLNPPEPGGSLSTTSPISDAVVLSGLEAVDPEAREFWTAGSSAFTFESQHLRYRPSYNYYQDAPTTRYEPTVVYSTFDDAQLVESQQSLVSGRTLNLMLVRGDIGGQAPVESVDVTPVATATRTIALETTGGAPEITVKTHLSEDTWDELLASNPDASVESYTENSNAPNTVTIDLSSGQWRLRVGVVGLNTGESPGPAEYIIADSETNQNLVNGETADLRVRVLDRFGSSVEGQTVSFEGTEVTTGADGIATFETAPGGDQTITAWIGKGSEPSADERKVTFDLDVDSSSSNLGTQVNPSDGVIVADSSVGSGDTVVVDFQNTESGDAEISQMRVNYYYSIPPARSQTNPPEEWGIERQAGVRGTISGDFISGPEFPIVVPDSSTETVTFEFVDTEGVGSFSVEEGDYFIVSVTFSDGSTRLYFVSPDSD